MEVSVQSLYDFIASIEGVEINGKVRESAGSGYGIFAARDIAKGDVIVRVPYSQCLSVHMILSVPQFAEIIEGSPGLLQYPDEIISMALLAGIGRSDLPWSRHQAAMPSAADFSSTLYWTESELEELKPSAVFHLTNLMKNQIAQDWQTIHEPLKDNYPATFANSSHEMYQWALSMVYSRAVGIHRNGEYVRCIPPVIDFANHSPFDEADEAADTFMYSENDDSLSLISAKAKKAGDECFAVYGTYPNSKLALTYGFVIPQNPHNRIDLWTKMLPTTNNYNEKLQLLSLNPSCANQTYDFEGTLRTPALSIDGRPPAAVSSSSPAAAGVSIRLIATIRIIQMTTEEIMDAKAQNMAIQNKMISVRNETATLVSLKNLLVSRLRAETAQEDKEKLGRILLNGDAPLSDRAFMALVIRVDERDLIQECLRLVENWTKQLEEQGEGYIPPYCLYF